MTPVAVSLITLILLVLSLFQIALAAGAPFGGLAWGGAHTAHGIAGTAKDSQRSDTAHLCAFRVLPAAKGGLGRHLAVWLG